MQSTRSRVLGASIGALLSLSAAGVSDAKSAGDEQSAKETAKQIQALRDQLDALQRRVDAQATTDQQAKEQASAAAAQAASANDSVKAATAAIPAQVTSAVNAAKPKNDKLYYKGVSITLGGFAAFESIYRTHNETADISSSFSAIPYPNGAVGHTGEVRFTARQSRVQALVQGDVDPATHLGFFGEFDFQGAAQTANSNESNSYNPRIRNLYGQIDWDNSGLHLLAGQNWSLVTLNSKGITPRNEAPPPTIDAQYIPGFAWTRQPQIRLTKDFDKTVWLAVSAENPQTTFYTGANAFPASVKLTYNSAAGSGFNSANTLSLNHIPDVVAKVAYEPTFADRNMHFEVFGLYRGFAERLNMANEDASGGGFGAGVMIPLIPKVLDFQVSGLAGKGIGRYGSSQLPDVTFDPTGHIRPISEVMGLAGLTLHAGSSLDIYAFAGEEKESAQPYDAVVAGVLTGYGYGNPLYSNAGCQYEGAPGACVGNSRVIEQATLGFWHRPYVGAFGRIQYGLQYSYTERKAFAGAGGISPVGNDGMLFASFRYYPF
ncbi:MAG: hypothetical protein ABJD53_01640 [Gammaproteobacteria bacterium]